MGAHHDSPSHDLNTTKNSKKAWLYYHCDGEHFLFKESRTKVLCSLNSYRRVASRLSLGQRQLEDEQSRSPSIPASSRQKYILI